MYITNHKGNAENTLLLYLCDMFIIVLLEDLYQYNYCEKEYAKLQDLIQVTIPY